MLASLKARMLYQVHHATILEHPSEKRMYYLLRRYWYWPDIIAYIYYTVKDCSQYSLMGTKIKNQQKLELYPPVDPWNLPHSTYAVHE